MGQPIPSHAFPAIDYDLAGHTQQLQWHARKVTPWQQPIHADARGIACRRAKSPADTRELTVEPIAVADDPTMTTAVVDGT